MPPLLSLPKLIGTGLVGDEKTFRIVYVGTLYKSLRSPKFLLKCFELVRKLLPEQRMELHFYGSVNDCHEDFVNIENSSNSNVFVHGMVSRQDVVIAMTGANVLVNIGNDGEAQLASKVIEYMSMGKPILNLVSINCDASISVLAPYSAKLTISRGDGKVKPCAVEALKKFICKPPNIDPREVAQARTMYSSDCVAGMYSSILEKKA
jgi:glycosyltransferase involved in cell wall biosynthesis